MRIQVRDPETYELIERDMTNDEFTEYQLLLASKATQEEGTVTV